MHNRKIKVVHIVEGFVGGLRTYVTTVLPRLVEEGYDVTLVCSLDRCQSNVDSQISRLRNAQVTVHVIPMCRQIHLLNDIRSFLTILKLILKNRYDVIHTHCSKAGALGRVAAFVAGRIPVVHSAHCFIFTRCNSRTRKLLYLVLERLLGKLTNKFVAVSRSEAAVAVRTGIIPSGKCRIVPNGLEFNGFRPPRTASLDPTLDRSALGIDEDTQLVLTGCRLVEYKGIFRFIDAAAICRYRNAVFVIAGEGKLKTRIEQYIRDRRLNKRIRLVEAANMKQLYDMCDIACLCSDREGQPYFLLEAMRAKCAIIATAVTGNRELIAHGKTGCLIAPESRRIAEAMDKLLTDETTRRKYAENAYMLASQHYSLANQVLCLSEIYHSCIGNGQWQCEETEIETRP